MFAESECQILQDSCSFLPASSEESTRCYRPRTRYSRELLTQTLVRITLRSGRVCGLHLETAHLAWACEDRMIFELHHFLSWPTIAWRTA
ncbi:DEAD/DEAH box helicase domain containing protein [Pseudozyma hubeiensis SY62]|uniref:DEAD/DEAH box helicase domain containing protein n=1 Tax=Pseudozyma hubeiensis (strain SY62) TaxID=1305764 RepID=R9PLI0_PSEHS|nr:DEAD/DEAH box helicase domain containing protein [Pseudozyma hubeiensis SY62]GAC98950.1 DEAD/DEAH box helicase domain containing protein [Pseudozyma hubeiensis SY62]